ncbi:hypothetical protein HY061_01875, partial [Candidatus Azambacteria bacterium]|nr:hypothetical protein [Candidatus Azambacteria bacterium]
GANLTFDASNGTGTGGSGAFVFRTAPTGSTGATANTLTERMRIDNVGNVGIGTTAPGDKLEVFGSGGTKGILIKGDPSVATNTLLKISATGSDNTQALLLASKYIYTNTIDGKKLFIGNDLISANAQVTIDTVGNVGIGTTAPGAKLHVSGTSAIFGVGEAGTPTATTLRGAAATGTDIAGANLTFDASNGTGTGGSGAFVFRTAPTGSTGATANTLTERMRINNVGNVGIGTTAPGTRLHTLDNTTTGPLGMTIENDGASTSNLLMFRIISQVGGANNVKFSIDSDGDLLTDGSTTIGTPADIAENYPVNDESINAGDLLAISNETIKNCSTEDQNNCETLSVLQKASLGSVVIGVVSENPGIILAGYFSKKSRPIALAGRVPVKVSLENGPIVVGDKITSSSVPGIAMKAIKDGQTIGIALESFDGTIQTGNGTTVSQTGKVLTFINLSYSKIDSQLATAITGNDWIVDQKTGRIQSQYTLDMNNKDIINVKAILSASNNWSIDESGTMIIREVVADTIKTKNLKVESGVTTLDRLTKVYYCVFVENGEIKKTEGECQSSATFVTPAPAPTVTSDPVPAPTPAPAPTVTSDPVPAPTPAPAPTVTSDPVPACSCSITNSSI